MSSSTSTSTSTSTSSTQPPLPLQHIYNSSNNSSHQNIINSVPFFTHLLSKLYVASHTLQLGTETRYAYFTLFHRCLSHYIHANINVNANANVNVYVNVNKYIPTTVQKEEIGNLAAASIFLACKLCNQQRRIRDVINVKHVLQFDQDTSTGTCTGTGIDTEERSKSAFRFQPPPLDDEYLKEKEEINKVSMEIGKDIDKLRRVVHTINKRKCSPKLELELSKIKLQKVFQEYKHNNRKINTNKNYRDLIADELYALFNDFKRKLNLELK